MKLLVLFSVAACTSAQLVDPFLGHVPWVYPSSSFTFKSAEQPVVAEETKPAEVIQHHLPLVYNYPFFPTTNVLTAAENNNEASTVITYSANTFPFYNTPLLKAIPVEADDDDDEDDDDVVSNVIAYSANTLPFYHTSVFRTVPTEVEDDDEDDDESPLAFLSKPLLYHGSPFTYANHVPLTYTNTVPFTYSHQPVASPAIAAVQPVATETARRKKRDIKIPLPFLRAVPDVKKLEYKTEQLDATDDATPADTTKLELTSKTHEVSIPTVKYVQDVVSVKPVKYTAPLVTTQTIFPGYGGSYPLTYSGLGGAYSPLAYSGFGGLYPGLNYAGGLPYQPYTFNGLYPYNFPNYGYPAATTVYTKTKEAEPVVAAEEAAPEIVAE